MKSPKEVISCNIKKFRKLKGWKQIDLAVASGWNISTIQRIENCKISIKLDQLQDIATALGVTVQDLQSPNKSHKTAREEDIRTELLILVSSLSGRNLADAYALLRRFYPKK